MYSRSYSDGQSLSLPDSYVGTAFDRQEPAKEEPIHNEQVEQVSAKPREPAEPAGLFGGILDKIPFLGGKLSSLHIGTEELLIAGVALFLLFSKGGDRECALILLALLFIG